jgi:MFS family permease
MTSAPIPRLAPGDHRLVSFDWYRSIPEGRMRHAFWASYLGYALDAFDFQALSFALAGIIASFALTNSRAGLVATVTLVTSAVGGALGGILADRLGRVRTLQITVAVFSVFSIFSGLAQNYEQLLVFRGIQGFGFGGEWGAGAALIAEIARPEQRGRVLGIVQSSWAIGWGAIALVYTLIFSHLSATTAWRVMFVVGAAPALFILFLRRSVDEPAVFAEHQARRAASAEATARSRGLRPLFDLFRPDLLRTTLLACLLSVGAQGGYYSLFTWLPTYLKQSHHLAILGVGSYLAVVIIGALIGYLVAAFAHDGLGHRRTFLIFAIGAALTVVVYTQVSTGGGSPLLIALGFPLGFFPSGMFSGFGSYLAELYPTRARGAGLGFTYNAGRGLGALFPFVIGVVSEPLGLGVAITLGASAYGLSLLALLGLPETSGIALTDTGGTDPAGR